MNVTLAYRGRSDVADAGGRQVFRLVPNLARDPVGFDAPLLQPLRFREAMSALHDVVINDLRYKPRDKTAYEQWKKNEEGRVSVTHRQAYQAALADIEVRRGMPRVKELEKRFEQLRKKYWNARVTYSNYLLSHDRDLWRMLMPCDPVITVAEDVAFFECFSADESSYGCLSVNREDGFGRSDAVRLGTTNVDYSWHLYHHFQSLRSYRETRFTVDPEGFGVDTAGTEGVREEKIDLPEGWLRGFMTLQSAMTMPGTRVTLPREVVYSVLAFLKRNKARKSPRAIRFELVAGRPPEVVLEPWETRIVSRGAAYDGPPIEPVRVWGARRLLVLARLLPLAERFDVHLLGSGLPHFWIAHMGEMRLTLGLSGWTTNDWTRGSAIDLLAPPAAPSPDLVNNVAAVLHERRSATLPEVASAVSAEADVVAAALRQLAHSGQAIADLTTGAYRWRQIMPRALGEAEIGPEHPELAGARTIMDRNRADLSDRQEAPRGGYVLSGVVDNDPVEVLVDADGRIRRGKCVCGYFRKYGLRNGPCRHMLALRWRSSVKALEAMRASGWYEQMRKSV
ncbi:MAG TPA: SWIM zinc finger family protein [Tepidisphaeraceae bacterium]|nr:SWIM zinc finger family protein [Tepidisphaeraceae bacterium]